MPSSTQPHARSVRRHVSRVTSSPDKMPVAHFVLISGQYSAKAAALASTMRAASRPGTAPASCSHVRTIDCAKEFPSSNVSSRSNNTARGDGMGTAFTLLCEALKRLRIQRKSTGNDGIQERSQKHDEKEQNSLTFARNARLQHRFIRLIRVVVYWNLLILRIAANDVFRSTLLAVSHLKYVHVVAGKPLALRRHDAPGNCRPVFRFPTGCNPPSHVNDQQNQGRHHNVWRPLRRHKTSPSLSRNAWMRVAGPPVAQSPPSKLGETLLMLCVNYL